MYQLIFSFFALLRILSWFQSHITTQDEYFIKFFFVSLFFRNVLSSRSYLPPFHAKLSILFLSFSRFNKTDKSHNQSFTREKRRAYRFNVMFWPPFIKTIIYFFFLFDLFLISFITMSFEILIIYTCVFGIWSCIETKWNERSRSRSMTSPDRRTKFKNKRT